MGFPGELPAYGLAGIRHLRGRRYGGNRLHVGHGPDDLLENAAR
jgi:hypothetical protein